MKKQVMMSGILLCMAGVVSAVDHEIIESNDDHLVSVGIDPMATFSELVGTELPDGPCYGLSALPFVLAQKNGRHIYRKLIRRWGATDGAPRWTA